MTFQSLPYEPRPITATEAVLERIYLAAQKGLRGDALAYAAGLMPVELRRLQQFDPIVDYAISKAYADNEMEMANVLREAALSGDTKAALDVLRYSHKWTAPQSLQVQVDQKISITHALEQAKARIVEGYVLDNAKAADADTSGDLLTNRNEDGGYDNSYASAAKKSTAI